MLSMFVIKRTFYSLTAKLYVDCESKEATLTVSYDGTVKRAHDHVDYACVMTPEKAEAYMGKPIHTKDGDIALIEYLNDYYRRHSNDAA
jgi:hypothetical protein